jgi:hypothetical protein
VAKTSRFPSLTDIDKLPPEERRRLRRALHPRNTMFSRRFNIADIAEWRHAADKLGVTDTDFFEETMNAAAAKILEKK